MAWKGVLALFAFASLIEAFGVSHVLAFAPLYLRELGAPPNEVPFWTGLVSSGAFLVGLPFVPLWGVWADKYSRKLIIVRSAYVEALVFFLAWLSQTPPQFVGATMLSGFQLGNTGVMYAALTAVAPKRRVGLALATMGVASPVGFALGPALAGPLADVVGLRPLYLLDAGLSLLSALVVTVAFHEARGEATVFGSVWRMAWEAVSGIVRQPVTRLVFLAYVLAFTGRQMGSPFLPLLVEELYSGENLATAVGLVTGGTALVGAVVSPGAGWLGDRLGYARVLGWTAGLGGLAAVAMAVAPSLAWLAVGALVLAATFSATTAMCVALLATTTPAERRSGTLNLALVPLYVGGIAGPALGAAAAILGVRAVFAAAAIPLAAGAAVVPGLRGRIGEGETPSSQPPPAPRPVR